MPRQTGLLCRKGRWYLNMRVPTDLRAAYGKKEIVRKALGTSEYREAVSNARFEAFRVEAEFNEKRKEIKARSLPVPFKTLEIDDAEAHEIVARFFIAEEKQAIKRFENGGEWTPEERHEAVGNVGLDLSVFVEPHEMNPGSDGSDSLDAFLAAEGLNIPKDSAAYAKLLPRFRQALIESGWRQIDRIQQNREKHRDPYFRNVFAHTQRPEQKKRVTLGQMLSRFFDWHEEVSHSPGTIRTYRLPARLMREAFGETTPVDSITKEEVERFFKLLRRVPINATQRYPGMTLEKAVAAADKRGDTKRLGGKTLSNCFDNVCAIFNFAVGKRLMTENPAKDRYFRESFQSDSTEKKKVLFTIAELNRLFRAPLYTGCEDDERGCIKAGPHKPRRGRFWLPFIALFHGLRCNEAAQLYSEDVCCSGGIPFFDIREKRADGSKCEKRIKTAQSEREVPIHPTLLQMGFLEFARERQNDYSHPRLFPELPCGASGYFSDPFSKWFARFVSNTLGAGCEATFHSFRHMFRDALRVASVPIDDVERLGGWDSGHRSAERGYGNGLGVEHLHGQIAKVAYPELNISHLFVKSVQPVAPKPSGSPVRRRRA